MIETKTNRSVIDPFLVLLHQHIELDVRIWYVLKRKLKFRLDTESFMAKDRYVRKSHEVRNGFTSESG